MEVITRAEARELGIKRFATGLACLRGHIAERFVKSGQCTECCKVLAQARYKIHRQEIIKKSREYREHNKSSVSNSRRKRYKGNKLSIIIKNKEYYAKNREKINSRRSISRKRLRDNDPVYAMKHRIRALIGASLTGRGFSKSSKTADILGCTWTEFKDHIELQFLPGMTWHNRRLWHIDHIVPLATAATEAEVLALNHFTNLRPLWGEDNLAKGATQTHLL